MLALLVFAGAFVLIALGEPAGAVADCRKRVIADWSDNGRIDGVYPLECYENAVESIPPDIRDYTDAPEAIGRALTLAVRDRRSDQPPRAVTSAATVDTSRTVSFPLPLLVLGALGGITVTGGTVAYARRRAERGHQDAAR